MASYYYNTLISKILEISNKLKGLVYLDNATVMRENLEVLERSLNFTSLNNLQMCTTNCQQLYHNLSHGYMKWLVEIIKSDTHISKYVLNENRFSHLSGSSDSNDYIEKQLQFAELLVKLLILNKTRAPQ